MVTQAIDASLIRRSRSELLARSDLSGRSLARRLCDQADGWFLSLGETLPLGWALAATGGYAAGQLSPGSDIDVLLLHPGRARDAEVSEVARALWYPLWDAGLKLSQSTHSTRSILSLAASELVTATAMLRVRFLAGDEGVVDATRAQALDQWRRGGLSWLTKLRSANEERWRRSGDVASLLEPDLKDGRGGLRDFDAVRWALMVDRPEVVRSLEVPIEDLAASAEALFVVRCELQRITRSPANVLALDDQDAVAEALGYADSDVLMATVSAAARAVDWTTERFWWRVGRAGERRRGDQRGGRALMRGAQVADDEVVLTNEIDLDDQSTIFRVAAAAAHAGYPLSRNALLQMSNAPTDLGARWSERTRQAFISLLGTGQNVVGAIEALEYFDLFSQFLPEWRHVRSLPQRNAIHTYTVDRHLLQTVANAGAFVRDVARPDLLLVGALLHDIGKGHPGDHTDVGVRLAETIAPRMGFDERDVATIRALVEHHLLLPETAQRRDVADPRTAENVARLIGDPIRLELLRALAEADGLATGPAAWSPWKETLLDELVLAVAAQMAGASLPERVSLPRESFDELASRVRAEGKVCIAPVEGDGFDRLLVASCDQPGLFAKIAGTLALHGVDIVSAGAWTDEEGIAADEFRVEFNGAKATNWSRIEHDLRAAVEGTLDLAARVEDKVRTYARARRRATAATPPRLEVHITNDASDVTTVVDVRAPDGLGVLYRLAATLAEQGLDIRAAKVQTLGHEVLDVFYVERSGRSGAARQLPESDYPGLHDALVGALSETTT